MRAPGRTAGGPSPERFAARLREDLFGTWYHSLLTLVCALLLGWAAISAVRFLLVTARWDIIRANLTSLLVGLFPRGMLWRPWAALFFAAGLLALATGLAGAHRPTSRTPLRAARRGWPVLLLLAAILVLQPSAGAALLVGGVVALAGAGWTAGASVSGERFKAAVLVGSAGFGVPLVALVGFGGVGWDRWGGLLLTLYLTIAGIAISFPFGVLLAIGRRSSMPAVRMLCVGYIEMIRGVPLITLLFMGSFVIGFLVPPGASRPSLIARALVALVLFTAAYLAEIVRGGLQSVPGGQVEAAQAVGLTPVKTMRLIVLPQALRAVIPAIVGQFISLYKDTSLVSIIGMRDLLRVAQSLPTQPRFLAQGLQAEVLVFASLIYWAGSYTMSRESRRLERRLGLGER